MSPQRHHTSNAILHGVSAGFGAARAVRAPIRRWYERRYHPRHRFPRFVFIFDLALLTTIASLALLVISIRLSPPVPPTLGLNISASPVVALAPVAVAARISPTDGKDHESVAVTWHVPGGWEIMEAEPPLRAGNTAYLGALAKDGSRVSRLVVRPFAAVGSAATIGLSVSHLVNGMMQTYDGSAAFTVASSTLTAVIPESFRTEAVAPRGAVIPVVVSNASDAMIPSVEVRPTDERSTAFPRIVIGDLSPQTSRIVYVPLGDVGASARLEWGVYAASREIDEGSFEAAVSAWSGPSIVEPLIARPHATTTVRVRGAQDASLLIVPPASTGAIMSMPLASDDESIFIPPSPRMPVADDRWLVAPIRTIDGIRTLGAGTLGAYVGSFPFSAEALYTSPAGDQLGIGPNPPRVGEQTTYWIFWRIGPIQNAINGVNVTADVGRRAVLTGNVALPDGGTSSISGRTIQWTLPRLGGTDATKAEATFGFEIAVTPASGDEGSGIELMSPSRAKAVSEEGIRVQAEYSAQYSEIVRQIEGEGELIRVE